eukprot:jgi/Mesen1/2903/ME000175S02056
MMSIEPRQEQEQAGTEVTQEQTVLAEPESDLLASLGVTAASTQEVERDVIRQVHEENGLLEEGQGQGQGQGQGEGEEDVVPGREAPGRRAARWRLARRLQGLERELAAVGSALQALDADAGTEELAPGPPAGSGGEEEGGRAAGEAPGGKPQAASSGVALQKALTRERLKSLLRTRRLLRGQLAALDASQAEREEEEQVGERVRGDRNEPLGTLVAQGMERDARSTPAENGGGDNRSQMGDEAGAELAGEQLKGGPRLTSGSKRVAFENGAAAEAGTAASSSRGVTGAEGGGGGVGVGGAKRKASARMMTQLEAGDHLDAALDAAAGGSGMMETERDRLIRTGVMTPFDRLQGFERRVRSASFRAPPLGSACIAPPAAAASPRSPAGEALVEAASSDGDEDTDEARLRRSVEATAGAVRAARSGKRRLKLLEGADVPRQEPQAPSFVRLGKRARQAAPAGNGGEEDTKAAGKLRRKRRPLPDKAWRQRRGTTPSDDEAPGGVDGRSPPDSDQDYDVGEEEEEEEEEELNNDTNDDDDEDYDSLADSDEEGRGEGEQQEEEEADDVLLEGGLRIPGSVYDKLFPYQQTGVKWMWELHCQKAGGIIGDEMGLGKTVQVAAFLGALHHSGLYRPSLVVCPVTLLRQWRRELRRWHPRFQALTAKRSDAKWRKVVERVARSEAGILLTTYERMRLARAQVLDVDWGYCVLDEGHRIRNPDAETTLVCKQVRTVHRLIMTGAPIQNRLTELWSLFDFVFPGKLGTLPVFHTQFALPIALGGYANAAPLQVSTAYRCAVVLRDLILPYLLRRMKADVEAHLPKKTEHVLFCSLTREQRALYRAFLGSAEVEQIFDGARNALYGIDVLRKICNHPDLLEREATAGHADYGNPTRSGKLTVVAQILKLWKQQGHRVLLFAQTQQMLDILEAHVVAEGHVYRRMDGATPVGQRMTLMDEFNGGRHVFVFLLTTRVGGLGTNLARERAWRIGQTREVTVYRLIMRGTIEEKVYHRQIYKQMLTNRILRDPSQRRLFKAKDLRDLFTLADDDNAVGGGGPGRTETEALFEGENVHVGGAGAPGGRPLWQAAASGGGGAGKEKKKKKKKRGKKAPASLPEVVEEGLEAGGGESSRRGSGGFGGGGGGGGEARELLDEEEEEELGGVKEEPWEAGAAAAAAVGGAPHDRGFGAALGSAMGAVPSAPAPALALASGLAPQALDDDLEAAIPGIEVRLDGGSKAAGALAMGAGSGEAEEEEDDEEEGRKKRARKGKAQAKGKGKEEEEEEDDARILQSLFGATGVHSAMDHEKILTVSEKERVVVDLEASRTARRAAEALRESRNLRAHQDIAQPTWTGRSGTAGAPSAIRQRFGTAVNTRLLTVPGGGGASLAHTGQNGHAPGSRSHSASANGSSGRGGGVRGLSPAPSGGRLQGGHRPSFPAFAQAGSSASAGSAESAASAGIIGSAGRFGGVGGAVPGGLAGMAAQRRQAAAVPPLAPPLPPRPPIHHLPASNGAPGTGVILGMAGSAAGRAMSSNELLMRIRERRHLAEGAGLEAMERRPGGAVRPGSAAARSGTPASSSVVALLPGSGSAAETWSTSEIHDNDRIQESLNGNETGQVSAESRQVPAANGHAPRRREERAHNGRGGLRNELLGDGPGAGGDARGHEEESPLQRKLCEFLSSRGGAVSSVVVVQQFGGSLSEAELPELRRVLKRVAVLMKPIPDDRAAGEAQWVLKPLYGGPSS